MNKFVNKFWKVELELIKKGLDSLTNFTEEEFHTIDELKDDVKEALEEEMYLS